MIWFFYVLFSGGKLWAMFTMDECSATCRWLDKMYSMARGSKSKAWQIRSTDVKTLVIDRKRNIIGLKDTLVTSKIYTAPEDYELVLNHIMSRVPKEVKTEEI